MLRLISVCIVLSICGEQLFLILSFSNNVRNTVKYSILVASNTAKLNRGKNRLPFKYDFFPVASTWYVQINQFWTLQAAAIATDSR